MTRRILGVTTLIAALVGIGSATAQADDIRVQSTTDTVDAGLVDGLLKPAYQAAQPGDTLLYTAVGTGAALTNARNGLADVVITHAPSLEAQFVTDGFSLEPYGRAIFYSDYVIVGPANDPAGVLANHPHDAIGAFEDIFAAGAAGTADFVSRGDNSGTNVQEQIMWGLTTTAKHKSFNAPAADTTRFEPGPGPAPANPAWYHYTNKGQAPSLLDAEACATATYPSGKCYTMTDRGTFNNQVNKGLITKLKIVADRNAPAARGGENLLINPFSAYIVNPSKFPGPAPPTPNAAAATRFLDFLTSPGFQTAVDTFPTTTDPAFRGDAFAKVTLSTPLPPTATAGSTVPINATLTNKLPGAPAVDGLPVQLQRSTDGGTTFTDVGSPVSTSATGAVSFSPTVSATTTFRFSMPRFHTLSPNDQTLGVVTIPGATPPPPPPPGPPPPPPPTPPDKTAPRVTKVKLAARKISMTISEAASVRTTIAKKVVKRVRRNGRLRSTTSYKTVKTLTLKGTKPGSISRTWKLKLSRGDYRAKLRATDLSGNVGNRTVHAHVKSS
jgi:tungstate transport system substrate-binding protein